MMTTAETREEILDLLARGKISIDEAVDLLDHSKEAANSKVGDDPLYKAELGEAIDSGELLKIKVADMKAIEEPPVKEKVKPFNDITEPERENQSGKQPRWLRVQVSNCETGKNKVTVNVPFGMVKFGLGIARVFSPEMKGVDLDDIGELFSNAESGLLVDVQDDESNEHVRVYFD